MDDAKWTAGAYVLSHSAVAELLRTVSCRAFLTELVSAIEDVYVDHDLHPLDRIGWKHDRDALEFMGCQSSDYTCVKLISSNPSLAGVHFPTVTGTLLCTEAVTDQARLVTDTALLTPLRTAAATAVAIRRLRPDMETMSIIGAGLEGTAHALVMGLLFDNLRRVVIADIDPQRAKIAAHEVERLVPRARRGPDLMEIVCRSPDDLGSIYNSDVLVTATYGDAAICDINPDDAFAPPTLIAAIGADVEDKRELGAGIYEKAGFVGDDLAQCLRQGELQHAAPMLGIGTDQIAAQTAHHGAMLRGRVIGMTDLMQGRIDPGADHALIVYDSTGFSGQDLALARVLIRFLKDAHTPLRTWNPPQTRTLMQLLIDDDTGVERRVT
jgi:ornithine cyclodeaminase/alanine dehydrogenase-like protein (mu-crystallin family)